MLTRRAITKMLGPWMTQPRRLMADNEGEMVKGGDSPYPANNRDTIYKIPGEKGVNKVTLIGRVGGDPVTRRSDESPVTFSLATSNYVKRVSSDGFPEYQQLTDWHKIVIFNSKLSEIAEKILQKGDRVYVTGKIQYSQYTQEGSAIVTNTTSIIADELIKFTPGRNSTSANVPPGHGDEYMDK